MIKPLHSIILIALFLINSAPIDSQVTRPIGSNLSNVSDYAVEFVFVDVFKQSRQWIAFDADGEGSWDSGVEVDFDDQGYPLEIPFNNGLDEAQMVRALMYFGNLEGIYPSGQYRLIASGTGQIRLWGAATGTFTCPVDVMVDVNNSLGGISLELEVSNVSDPVKDIRFIMPGHETTYQEEPFHPSLLDYIEDFQSLRFMDQLKTNNSTVLAWYQRTPPDYYTQTIQSGVAYEYIVDLCNRTGKDPWICVPHQATESYISDLANFLQDNLDENLKIYIEYSNEVWNGIFTQNAYVNEMGEVLGYTGENWEQGWKYYAKRSADIFQIFEDEFDDDDRFVKVISSQAANSYIAGYIMERFSELEFNATGVEADALSIAPYFGGGLADAIGDAGLINTITVNGVLDSLQNSLNDTYGWMENNKQVADEYNLELLAYEGGQHLVTYSYSDNTNYVNLLADVNRHPDMEDLYCQYLNYWYDELEGGLFSHFSSHGSFGQYGYWGVKETYADTLAPKYLGLKNCVFSHNTDTSSINIPFLEQDLKVFPNPSYNGLITIEHNLRKPSIKIHNSQGQKIPFEIINRNSGELVLDIGDYQGFAIIQIKHGKTFLTEEVIFKR